MEINIKDGYKITEVGVIPDDWDVKKLGDIALVSSGGTPNRSNLSYWNGNIPWITTSQIDFNTIISSNEFITELGLKNSSAKMYYQDTLLMAMYGQGKTRGKVGILGIDATINQACAAITINKDVYNNYVFFYLANNYEEIRKLSNTGNQENLNGNIIKSIFIPLPPVSEQKAIAHALSDVDNLITAIDQLITKKRNIKQGTMQQLLTGKKRLPGFSGEWEVKKLGEILKVKHGKSQHNIIDENGEFPILATGGEIGKANTYLYNKPSVLIGRKGTIDIPQYMDTPFWTIDTLFYTEIFNNAVPKFVFYRFNLINWYSYNEASGVPSLNAKTIENIDISFPNNFLEQKAIAEILSDIDKEIEALEKNRDKYKAIKQGMMQELLTGKTRIIDN
jgi:type I restriction enzyme S subunit